MKTRAKRRLFFGIEVADALHRDLISARDGCQLPAPGRPIPNTNWHLTLAFLGGVPAAGLPCILRAADGIQGRAFTLTLEQFGHWRGPQVLWAAPGIIPDELSQLERQLRRRLASCGFKPKTRPYAPHLTLLRKVRRVIRLARLEPLSWRVTHFHLYQSVSARDGPRYPIIGSWELV